MVTGWKIVFTIFRPKNSMKSFPDLFSKFFIQSESSRLSDQIFLREAVYTCPSKENVGPIDLSNF